MDVPDFIRNESTLKSQITNRTTTIDMFCVTNQPTATIDPAINVMTNIQDTKTCKQDNANVVSPKMQTASNTLSFDNMAFINSESDASPGVNKLPDSQNNSSTKMSSESVKLFMASGFEDQNKICMPNIDVDLKAIHDISRSEIYDEARKYKCAALSEIDIQRLATPTPSTTAAIYLQGRERSDSLQISLYEQSSMIGASSTTLSTVVVDEIENRVLYNLPVVEDAGSLPSLSSSSSVVCMNTEGHSIVVKNTISDHVLANTVIQNNLEATDLKRDSDTATTNKSIRTKGPIRMDSDVSRTSSMWSEGRGCRICWNSEEKEPFIQPCHCSGSSANVHVSCLKKWLHVTNQFKCEICNFEYKSSSALKPMTKWSWKCSKTRNLSQLEATLILLGIVTPPLICGIVLCSQKIVEYVNNPEHAWKTAGSFAALMTLVIASSLTYLTALVYFGRKITAVCRQWVQTNQRTVVRLGGVDAVIEQTPETQQSRDNDLNGTGLDMYSVWSVT